MKNSFLMISALALGLGGCAASPEKLKNEAYDAYWQCASQAVRPYVGDTRLPPRQAALRAQARCNDPYQRFRNAQVGLVRHKVQADSADLAEQLGGQQALVWRQRVTRTLTDYVRQARRSGVGST
ncbi:hypothetical protein [Salinisphaera sp. Q1T1-3]|uniref:hypothetical protein n=1 Tax=Salinisphaera sp. Q1T1-3 TaxID=2321229 RepID=UPI000E72915B|nr:hypothetical protein [Salinisphaera sp. Q1T1-3]RJS91423.1 hypothetical protein D3260_15590 [Salinisphaera sp. Q1T1-3]